LKFAIETENLTKRFGNGVMALQNLNIGIPQGQIVGYVGSNGAGKTTTMKILTSLIRPTAGRAFIDGINVQRNPKKALFNVGALIEIPGVYENLTPWEMLTFYGKIYGMTSREVHQRIEEDHGKFISIRCEVAAAHVNYDIEEEGADQASPGWGNDHLPELTSSWRGQ